MSQQVSQQVRRREAQEQIQQADSRAWLRNLERVGWALAILITVFFTATYGLRAELANEAERRVISQQSQEAWSTGQKRRYTQFVSAALPPMTGVLHLPTLDASVPIFADESEVALTLGAAHLFDTAALNEKGNIVLSSHRDGPFRALRNLRIGDPVELHAGDRQRAFTISKISIVPPTAVDLLAPSENTQLTLITCFPFYFIGNAPERFVVQATPVDTRRL